MSHELVSRQNPAEHANDVIRGGIAGEHPLFDQCVLDSLEITPLLKESSRRAGVSGREGGLVCHEVDTPCKGENVQSRRQNRCRRVEVFLGE